MPSGSVPTPGGTLRRAAVANAAVHSWLEYGAVHLLFFIAAIWLQAPGTYSAELAGHPDEAAHYTTGLMVRDYIAAGLPGSPLRFAENYYLHYPQVALGHWPPVFYALQALWTLPFSPTRLSLMLFMATITALVADTLYATLRAEVTVPAALTAGLLFVGLPIVRAQTSAVMAEMPLALFSFLAVRAFGRFMESERTRDTLAFGLWATLAILTKGNGWALVALPLLTVFITGRLELVRRAAFWYPALLVALFCAPWTAATMGVAANGMLYEPGATYTALATRFYAYALVTLLAFPLTCLALLGVYAYVVVPRMRGRVVGVWPSLAAWIVVLWAFHALVPAGLERRHVVGGAIPLVIFATAGLWWAAKRLAPGKATMLVTIVTGTAFLLECSAMPPKRHYGFAPLAVQLLERQDLSDSVFLVSSEADGEGMLVSEIAMHEARPGHIVLRARKLLAQGDWIGRAYRSAYRTPEAIQRVLENIPVGVVAVEITRGATPIQHHRLIIAMLRQHPERWRHLATFRADPKPGRPSRVLVYELIGHQARPRGAIHLDLRDRIGVEIEHR